MSKSIKCLNGFRFVLSLFVFFAHNSFYNFSDNEKLKLFFTKYSHLGGVAVTAFFILSGFCIYLGYGCKFSKLTKESYFDFLKKRIIKIYPLYFVTMIIVFIFQFVMSSLHDFSFLHLIYRFFSHMFEYISCAFMIQIYFPNHILDGNGAAWFISSISWIYLITPFVLHFISKRKVSNKKALGYALFFILIVFLFEKLCALLQEVYPENSNIIREIFYTNPFVRLPEYMIGIFISIIFTNVCDKNNTDNEKSSRKLFSFLEVVFFMLPPCFNWWGGKFNLEVFCCLFYSLFIFVVSFEKGFLSHLFKRKTFIFLGSFSMEIYLIHYVLLILEAKFPVAVLIKKIEYFWIFAIPVFNFFLTLLLSFLWKKYRLTFYSKNTLV